MFKVVIANNPLSIADRFMSETHHRCWNPNTQTIGTPDHHIVGQLERVHTPEADALDRLFVRLTYELVPIEAQNP